MKKLIAIMLVMLMVLSLAACGEKVEPATEPAATEPAVEVAPAMTWDEYMAAELETEVVVECYVQAAQGWWFSDKAGHGVITVYAQDDNGGYFMYDMACEEADAEKLVPGTKIRVTGYKAEWSGEIEIIDATFEIIEGETKIYEAEDVTALLGTEDLAAKQNMFVSFKGMTFVSLTYKDDEWDRDIYVTLSKDGAEYSFCVENYLTGPDTEVYQAVEALEAGAVVDIEGFAYWYEGINTHITSVTVAE